MHMKEKRGMQAAAAAAGANLLVEDLMSDIS
jgi:hypothetical protein